MFVRSPFKKRFIFHLPVVTFWKPALVSRFRFHSKKKVVTLHFCPNLVKFLAFRCNVISTPSARCCIFSETGYNTNCTDHHQLSNKWSSWTQTPPYTAQERTAPYLSSESIHVQIASLPNTTSNLPFTIRNLIHRLQGNTKLHY